MVNSIKSLLEIDENTARKFTVVHILENCVNNIKYSMLSTVLTAKTVLLIIENVAIFDKLGNSGVHKFFEEVVSTCILSRLKIRSQAVEMPHRGTLKPDYIN